MLTPGWSRKDKHSQQLNRELILFFLFIGDDIKSQVLSVRKSYYLNGG